jgi:tartrate-resistant acid phosphatase type 5
MMRFGACISFIFGLSCTSVHAAREGPRPIQLDDHSNSLNFLMHGDWGWNNYNQSLTAYEMGIYAWLLDAQFVMALGDNFYEDGVASATDTIWDTAFHDVYASESLNIPWYGILGNHDYHGSVDAQVERTFLRGETMWTMPGTYYEVTYDLPDGGTMCVVYIDTQLLDPYQKDTELILANPNWQVMRNNHLKWIDTTLAEHAKTDNWLIVAGHYPIYSIGEHGDDSYLVADLAPLLEKHGVHAYMTAHDHNHQHFKFNGIHHFITGNSAGRGPFGPHGWQNTDISVSTPYIDVVFQACGFSFVEVTKSEFNVSFVDNYGRVRHTEVLSNPLNGEKYGVYLHEMFASLGMTGSAAAMVFLLPIITVGIFAAAYMAKDSLSGFTSAIFVRRDKISLEMDDSTRSSHGMLPVHRDPNRKAGPASQQQSSPTFFNYRKESPSK